VLLKDQRRKSGGFKVKTRKANKVLMTRTRLGVALAGLILAVASGCGPINQPIGNVGGAIGGAGLVGGANCAPLGSQPIGFQAQGATVNVFEQRVLAGYIPPNYGPLGWLDHHQGQTFGQATPTPGAIQNVGGLPNVAQGTFTFQSTTSFDANLQISLVPQQQGAVFGTNPGFTNPFGAGWGWSAAFPRNFLAQVRGTILINPDPGFIAVLYDALFANPWILAGNGDLADSR
jgi:hypothetical protein